MPATVTDFSCRLFLHGFEQGSLGFRGGAVDFVGKDDIGKDRALDKLELAVFVEYLGASDVGGHEVGGELDTAEREAEGFRKGVYHQRLGQTRNADKQAVPTREDRKQEAVHGLVLTHNHLGHFALECVVALYKTV